jgi:hypothetical protein
MSFTGNTGNAARDAVQRDLAQNIGNASTMSHSIGIAIACENTLYERSNRTTSSHYTQGAAKLLTELKNPQGGQYLQQRMLVGALRPNLFVEEHVTQAKTKTKAKSSAPKKKKEEKKRTAKDYYFFKSTPQAEFEEKYAPKAIDAPQPSMPQPVTNAAANTTSAPTLQKASSTAPSAWNRGGTWEERNLTPFTKSRIPALMNEAFGTEFVTGELKAAVSDWKVDGSGQLVMVRGKQRLGFEVKVTAEVKGTYGSTPVEAKIILPSTDMTESEDGDFDFNMEISKPAVGTREYSALRGAPQRRILAVIQEQMRGFVDEFKAEAYRLQ